MTKSSEGAEEAEWARQVRSDGHAAYVNGWYAPSNEREPAVITLYVGPTYRPVPSLLWWSSVITLRIIRTLAHEVAHHLIATRGYVFDREEDTMDEEALATRFSADVLERTKRRWTYRLGGWFLKDLAGWYYSFAIFDWQSGDFKNAARRFYNAWDLCPEHEEAQYWYWRAKEMSNSCQLQS